MTDDRKRWLTGVIKRKADVIIEATDQPCAIPQLMSVADEHISEEDIDFVIEESMRLARESSPR